jgi:4-amino-4-deoxy-L-arabinose transferase-like glycosyltransferase
MPVAIAVITLTAYLPFFGHILNLRDIQINNNEDVREVLPIFGSDSIGYGLLADSMIEQHSFSGSSDPLAKPDTFRTPGYPAILAVFKYIFGSYKYFPLVQILFTILTAIFIYKIGTKIFSESIALIASLLYVLDPNTIWHTLTILSDIPFALFLILSLYYLFFSDFKNQYWASVLGGLFLGIATLIRPISMFMPLFFLPIYFYINKDTRLVKDILKNSALFLGVFVIILVPWYVRNKQVSGVWGISSVKDFNFFHYTMPEYLSFKRGVMPDDIRNMFYAELEKKGVDPRDAASLSNNAVLNEIALPYLKEDIFGYGKWHAVKMIPFFLSSGIKNCFYIYNAILGYTVYETNNSNLTNFLMRGEFGQFFRVLKGQFLITAEQFFWLFICLAMLIPLLYKKKRAEVLLLLVLIFYLALPTVPVAYARFRIPAAPFMLILATVGLTMTKDYFISRLAKNS